MREPRPSDARLLADFYGVAWHRREPRAPHPAQLAADPPEAARAPWPDWWCGPTDPMVARRCRSLWASVLAACLADSLMEEARVPLGVNARARIRDVGASWWRSRHMRDVAALAGFDGVAMQERIAAMVAREGAGAVAGRLSRSCDQARRDGT